MGFVDTFSFVFLCIICCIYDVLPFHFGLCMKKNFDMRKKKL